VEDETMTGFDRAWTILKEHEGPLDPNDPEIMEKIEEKIRQLKLQQEDFARMRENVDKWSQSKPTTNPNIDDINEFGITESKNQGPTEAPQWEQKMMNDFSDWKKQAEEPPKRWEDLGQGNSEVPEGKPPFVSNFTSPQKMCQVCKTNPAMINSPMCGTCANEMEGIEQRNQESRNNLQEQQDSSDSFADYSM
jgi:hypothetical protein